MYLDRFGRLRFGLGLGLGLGLDRGKLLGLGIYSSGSETRSYSRVSWRVLQGCCGGIHDPFVMYWTRQQRSFSV